MKRLLLLPLLLLALAAPAAAGGPRDEKERLTKADNALARRALVRAGDLPAGWRRGASPPDSSGSERCAAYDPDFSAFTISGKAGATYAAGSAGAEVAAQVQVFPTRSQARRDFALGAKPGLLRCFERDLRQQLARAGVKPTRLTTTPMASLRGVGERAVRFRIVVAFPTPAGSVTLVSDNVALQSGRGIAVLSVSGVGRLPLDDVGLAHRVATRLS
jgi:hypothetical protein